MPALAHFSLLVGRDGEALSKRLGSLSVEGFRDAGYEPMAVNSLAALIGTSDAIHPVATLPELAATFDFAKLSRSPSRFDTAELAALNAKLLHMLPYDAVAARLATLGVDGGPQFWAAVHGNLTTMAEAVDWHRVVTGPIAPVIEDAAFAAKAAALLPPAPWTAETWSEWTTAVRAATGAKGRALFHPLRLALTARETGPELKTLLPLIGRERAVARLAGNSA